MGKGNKDKNKKVKVEETVAAEETVDAGIEAVSLLFKGKFYSGADGLGGFLKVKEGQEVIVSVKVAEGILESWPNEWEML